MDLVFSAFHMHNYKKDLIQILKVPGIEFDKMEFENELHTNDEHVINKIYKHLLRFELKEEQAEECMVKWAKNFCYNIQMDQF